MATMTLMLCVLLVVACCLPKAQAWLWSWGHDPTWNGDVKGVPGFTDDWSASISASWSFSRAQCVGAVSALQSRDDWGASSANRQAPPLAVTPRRVYVYQTGACHQSNVAACVQEIQHADLSANKDDIRFNFLVGQDGKIYVGRGWTKAGQHTRGQNSASIGVGFIGDFSNSEPNQESQDAYNTFIVCGENSGKLKSGARMTAHANMVGDAFYNMLKDCDGFCVSGKN